ncbi:MFS transporter permease [Streptomyces agglomeratus]|uniref:MFS transporter n=1 Tax=Streptomyces agglomeratus TaxID=285458 RepID=UPI000854F634|nr:MFS transporter [Streptomyces agglomeratus]OEJ39261.1 MFS transporter permease [Streptomyces agglomeratus]OEJ46356.1 MFS transporter permease [Streptomyces agglomeratus]OEJ51782.1 MFS transporter permease [Streptomyces agglomeratus]OEJ59187.1 MFS transporter permease [Streptomyces agglomeratus]
MTARGGRKPFAAVLAANTISTAGTSLTMIGVPWFVLDTTGSAGRAGVVAFCATLPVVVSALVGGPFIDRIGRRRVSVASDLVCGLAVGAIPLLHWAGALEFWMLCALMALGGLAHTPGMTARYVLVPDLAAHAGTTLARAASLFEGVSRGARMIGAALAGVLIAVLGAEAVLLLDAATFAGSALLVAGGVRGVRAAEPRKAAPVSFTTYRTELREGYVFLLRQRLLLAVVLMVMLTNGLDQGWSSVLLPVHAKENLGGATDLGMLAAVFGGCALLGALLYGAVGERFPRRIVFTVAFLLCGLPRFVVAALVDGTAALAVTMAAGGLAAGMLNPILTTVTYERVPQELRSRVGGVSTAGCELTMPLGGLAAGLLVEEAGLVTALLVVGGAYFLATLSPVVFPSWRAMDGVPAGAPLSSSEPSRPSSPARPAPAPRP